MSHLPTPNRSVSPSPPIVQPDHFYGSNPSHVPPSPHSERRTWLSPDDDPLAHRGIPVFKPTIAEFEDFEDYMNKIECWGMRSGIVKVIPPKEWTDSLPSIIPQLREIQINCPIEQHMIGHGGLFRQENLEKRKFMSVREWVDLCRTDDLRAPGVQEVGKRRRRRDSDIPVARSRRTKKNNEPAGPTAITAKLHDQGHRSDTPSALSVITPLSHSATICPVDKKPKLHSRRNQTKEQREANHARNVAFVDSFDPEKDWLPPDTMPSDYTVEFCQELERIYWRNLGLSKPAWYGADSQGSLFTDETKNWNVAHLPSTLSRLLPSSDKGLPGVNTPYLYFGMWRATFAWHVEDMDLFSINYIHFGAPKFWYAVPQGRACALEQTMRSYFPQDTSACPQFLRHKSFLASPTHLANNSCRPNFLVQHAREFVITFPRGYHAGLNLGLNCAESVNFALDSWIEIGRKAQVCKCVEDSVVIDVDQLLNDRGLEQKRAHSIELLTPTSIDKRQQSSKRAKAARFTTAIKNEELDFMMVPPLPAKHRTSKKRKAENGESLSKVKKIKVSQIKSSSSPSTVLSLPKPGLHPPVPKLSVTLKLPPRLTGPESFPCCLCVSQSRKDLLRVYDPPVGRKDATEAAGNPEVWMAHEQCAKIVPETWVDEIDGDSVGGKERMVFGVDGIVKDRWHLKCSWCTRNKSKVHGAPVQCTKGKCPKAFHVSCAQDNSAILFEVVKEVVKEVVLTGINSDAATSIDMNPTEGVPMEKNDQVLKVVKKLEIQVLCTQHNPAVAAEKKASKQERIKKELTALPSMSRIKIRVSAGVFEVSLVRVVEDSGSVEVLWDRGLKKEFKWGSVVFGSTDGPVHQKPSEPAPGPLIVPQTMAPGSHLSVPLRSPTSQPSFSTSSTPSSQMTPVPMTSSTTVTATSSQPTTSYSVPYHQQRSGYNYWPYCTGQTSYPQYTYPYAGYYTNVPMNGTIQHATYGHGQYRSGQLQWQQPYQGPRPGPTLVLTQATVSTSPSVQPAETSQMEDNLFSPGDSMEGRPNRIPNTPPSSTSTEERRSSAIISPSTIPLPEATMANVSVPVHQASNSNSSTFAFPDQQSISSTLTNISTHADPGSAVAEGDSQQYTLAPEMEQAILRNLQALSSMPEVQLAELLQGNPQLKTLLAIMHPSKPTAS